MTKTKHADGVRLLAAAALLFAAVTAPSSGQETDRDEDANPERTELVVPAQNAETPRQHFRVTNPADLDAEGAERIYGQLREDLASRYRLSTLQPAADYIDWRRYNTAPYRSVTHGLRFVNNYVNAAGRSYGRYEDAGVLPQGSVIAKDSFTVTETGDVTPGPLFLMEKMAEGFSYVSGDWRYTMILPDGSLYGTTNGDGHERVMFCISCHLAVEHQDHLFFLPEEFRSFESR